MAHVVVVGAGLSGVGCARELVAAGHDVVLRDRGRRPGGRMALRRVPDGSGGEHVADIGASYFTVRDPAFEAVVSDWRERGLARPWTDTFVAWTPDGRRPKPGPVRWAAAEGLRALVQDLAAGLEVRSDDPVESVGTGSRPTVDGEAVDAVVLALPDPQARRLLEPGSAAHEALDDPYEPALALVTRWPDRSWPDEHGIFVDGHPDLAWVADDGLRRGDAAPVLVAHTTADRAAQHLDDPAAATDLLVEALRDVVDLPDGPPEHAHTHRWTFSRPADGHDAPFHLGDDGIGACGDAWGRTSSVETAFLSGRALGLALAARLA